MNNEEKPVGTQQPAGQSVAPAPKTAAPGQASVASKPEAKPDRTFTRDEVTTILKKRFDRFSNGFYKKYGVKDAKELDEIWEKRKNYDDVITERDGLKTTNAEMTEELAFLSNGIDPNRYDDVKTYFKGKGLAFDKAILKEHLVSHPEWVKQQSVQSKPTTTVQKIGAQKSDPPAQTEQQLAESLYGMKLS